MGRKLPEPPDSIAQGRNAAEVKLDLIDYVTAKMPFNSPRQQVSVIT